MHLSLPLLRPLWIIHSILILAFTLAFAFRVCTRLGFRFRFFRFGIRGETTVVFEEGVGGALLVRSDGAYAFRLRDLVSFPFPKSS
jgi:hypothetical protein